jgi:hypothetical protein
MAVARISTIVFIALSMSIATQVNSPTFKDIITIVIKWVAGLIGPISIPLLLGMLPLFRRSGPTAAPVVTSLVLFTVIGYLRPENTPERDALLDSINDDGREPVLTGSLAPDPTA